MSGRMLFYSSPAYTGGEAFTLWPHLMEVSGADHPRICYVPTATGDNPDRIAGFYEALQPFGFRPHHVSVIRAPGAHVADLLLASDVIYVAGGNTAAMLSLWRRFGLDEVMRRAWEAGVLLSGHSAGAICWFEAFLSDSYGGADPFTDGLGMLAGSCVTHYDSQPHRPPAYREAIGNGLPGGYAMADGTALYVEGTHVTSAFTVRPDAVVHRVEVVGDEVTETPLDMTVLERRAPAAP